MSCKLACAIVVLATFFAFPLGASGEEGSGWKLPNLNPFSRKAAPPTSARISDDDWKLPGSRAAQAQAKPKGPSVWQRMTTSTKTMFSKTADALNPFDDAKDNEPVRVTGSRNAFRQASAKKSKSGSFLPSLWNWGSEEDDRPKDVNDFLSRPRPEFP
jgi:hypothetical protein